MERIKVIIVGGGFAGLQLARSLHSSFAITLIDKVNYHQFQPLFYQVASARLEPSSISFPLRKVFHNNKNVNFRLGEVNFIDNNNKMLYTSTDVYSYDILIIATGCTTNYFGNNQIENYAMPMKTTTEAMALRNKILLNFEKAISTKDKAVLDQLMNIVIVGAGPTGVELAGALAEMKSNILPKDYPDFDFSRLTIYLLEAGPSTLGPMSAQSQQTSQMYLEQLGVNVKVNTSLQSFDGGFATLKSGEVIPTNTLIWAAGVTGNLIKGINDNIVQRGNRIKVDRYNRLDGFNSLFAIGDIAFMVTDKYKNGHPQVANVAINQAKNLARNLNIHYSDSLKWKTFEYKDQGSMATVGKRKAVVDLPKFNFQGRFAWYFWMFLHLMLILSVKNKLSIFLNWTISYFTNDTTLRLILLPSKKQLKLSEKVNQDMGLG